MARMFPPLLLKNGGGDRNMCSLNSNLQLLRHVPEFVSELISWRSVSPLLDSLHMILSKCGTLSVVSASTLRYHLEAVTNKPLNSGEQHDTMEFLNFLLDNCPNTFFSFKTSLQYRFLIDGKSSPCPTCK